VKETGDWIRIITNIIHVNINVEIYEVYFEDSLAPGQYVKINVATLFCIQYFFRIVINTILYISLN